MIDLSIIIPTRNKANNLYNTLKSISELENKDDDFEVIVIDNASKDNTVEVIEDYVNKIRNFRFLYLEKIGLHEGRNLGLKEAKGEILCYLDDDVCLYKSWLNGIRESFKDKDVVLVGGKNLPKFETKPPEWLEALWNSNEEKKVIGYLSILDFGDEAKEIDPLLVFGCNFSIRKKILIEASGFHPDGFPQELIKYRGDGESYVSQYIKDKGYKAWYNPSASVYHFVPKDRATHEYFKKRAFNQGISDSYSQVRSLRGNRYKIVQSFSLNLLRYFKSSILTGNNNYSHDKLRGIIFHQMNCLIDKRLMEYVLKDVYWESSKLL